MERAAVLFVAVLLGLSFIDPPYPREQLLQHLPTVPSLVALHWASRRGVLSRASIFSLLAFLVLHIVGARYIYSFVPYDRVFEALAGRTASDVFDLSRNHYDRFVHLAFGLLFVLPLAETGKRYGGMRRRWAVALGVAIVLALSALYESFEWGLTMVLSPHQAESYNGQQGDLWDAQKDIALAALGAILAVWSASRGLGMTTQSDRSQGAVATARVTLHMAASLDGFVARKDGSVDWLETSDEFANGESMEAEFVEAFLATIDCYVMGSRTYETALGFEAQGLPWAYGDKPTFVLTTRDLPRTRDSVEFCSGDLTQLVNERLRSTFRSIWIVGGGVVAAASMRLGLVDELRYSILPVLIGDGIPFLAPNERDTTLHLSEVKAYKTGMVELCYDVR